MRDNNIHIKFEGSIANGYEDITKIESAIERLASLFIPPVIIALGALSTRQRLNGS